ncbi:hypothetical protein [Aromatoleum aromaticum]|uniref:Uncharacterized protein n=1 Tax=Aromatoleum aromaticum (strain DSM 19018 / LMG 30748 / EbN1) TaxID=76114 RepID=Q5P7N7_AROAE|nr:hypothetical protein [Aromatoleum aromaticum]NMG53120.1 hypothetical protein [Aromatoleum aromaticum]CAI06674.1 hypothetical protein ebA1048 [Aromatoleum aromaticum EbN1]
MRRETAYKLAGRHHDHPVAGTGLEKQREIRFASLPPGQVAQAMRSLQMFKGLRVSSGEHPLSLVVSYSVLEFSLEMVESALSEAGFHLDGALYWRLVRTFVYFCEETQRHNLGSPERLIKKSNEVYVTAYDHHLHGDHDDTPLEFREYK